MSQKKGKYWKKLLLLFASLLFGMLIGEIVLRVMAPPSVIDAGIIKAGMFENDDYYGWKHISDFEGVQSNPEFTIDIRINSDGYRCKWLLDDLKKEKEALKILGVGDSFRANCLFL